LRRVVIFVLAGVGTLLAMAGFAAVVVGCVYLYGDVLDGLRGTQWLVAGLIVLAFAAICMTAGCYLGPSPVERAEGDPDIDV